MEMSGQLHTPATLSPGKKPLSPIKYKVDWAVRSSWRRGKNLFGAGNQTWFTGHTAYSLNKLKHVTLSYTYKDKTPTVKYVMVWTLFYILNRFSVLYICHGSNQDTWKVSPTHVMVKEVLLKCPCLTSTTTVTLNCSHINGKKSLIMFVWIIMFL